MNGKLFKFLFIIYIVSYCHKFSASEYAIKISKEKFEILAPTSKKNPTYTSTFMDNIPTGISPEIFYIAEVGTFGFHKYFKIETDAAANQLAYYVSIGYGMVVAWYYCTTELQLVESDKSSLDSELPPLERNTDRNTGSSSKLSRSGASSRSGKRKNRKRKHIR